MLREMHIEPTALDNGFVPVDIDVTPFDNSKSNKEGVSRTYKGFDGYAPIMAYFGTEGYLVNLELRIGKQHCQKETPDFLRETIELCRQLTEKPLLIRLDSVRECCQTKQSLIFTMPTEKVCSITVKSRRTWMLKDSRRESLRATNWCRS